MPQNIQEGVVMNPGQENFFSFMMDRVQPGKEAELKALLEEGFKKQDEWTFTEEYKTSTMSKYFGLLKSDAIEEVKNIFQNFKGPISQ